MGTSGSHFKFSRLFLLGCSGALVLAAACGENPEVLIQGRPATSAGAGLGEACAETGDCATPLFCGPKKQCIGTCGDITSKSCGNEACLPSGLCSLGMGNDCSTDADCNAGLKCSGVKHCSVPCVPGAQDGCPNGDACRDDATCPTKDDIMIGVGGSGNQGTGGEDSGAAGASSCIDVNVEFTPQIPTVLFLIDRSLSMTNERGFGAAVKAAVDDGTYALGTCPTNNDWRWNVVRDVLMNPTKGLVKPLEDRVRFGLTLYSSHNGRVKPITMGMPSNPVELDPARECPELVNVPIALNNADAMLAQFGCSDLAVDTPTGESLLAVADSLKAFTEPGPKVIVLATDGEPDSCDCPNFDNITSRVPENCRGANAAKAQQDVKDQVVANAKAIHADDITV
ncbi:MAG TPA: hypothetical protein VEQ58_14270, partial [Polyangiaceae bacterium]|nr:hypothetical protein [Polyangiaceae bacterium]